MDDSSTREGRCYTRARRFPWVIGQIQGWTIPFGPYTATQLTVLLAGFWMIIQTYSVWRHLGPFAVMVLAAPPAACWAVRHARIEGRSPLHAAAGLITLVAEPSCGRIRRRLARDHRPVWVNGAVRLDPVAFSEVPVQAAAPVEQVMPDPGQGQVDHAPEPAMTPASQALTPVQALLAECSARRG